MMHWKILKFSIFESVSQYCEINRPCVCIFWPGHRIGKGEGFADLEFAMLVKMNAVNENTVIATTVHDDQV